MLWKTYISRKLVPKRKLKYRGRCIGPKWHIEANLRRALECEKPQKTPIKHVAMKPKRKAYCWVYSKPHPLPKLPETRDQVATSIHSPEPSEHRFLLLWMQQQQQLHTRPSSRGDVVRSCVMPYIDGNGNKKSFPRLRAQIQAYVCCDSITASRPQVTLLMDEDFPLAAVSPGN